MDISVVIPAYNEEESLPELIAWIERVMLEHKFSWEAIIIDDGSTDKTWHVIGQIRKDFPQVKGIRFQRNYGKSAALNTGFQAVKGDVAITMDADLQDSPEEIPDLYRMITEEGYDLVSGWKKKRYDPISKTLPTKLFNAVTRKVSGIKLHDFNCGLKAYRGQVVRSIEVFGEMHRYIPVIAKGAGFRRIGEKVVQHQARKYGKTKFGMNRFVNGILDLISIVVITKYMKRPMHFFGLWGLVFAAIGGGFLIYLLIYKLFGFFDVGFGGGLSNRMPAMIFGTVSFLLGVLLISTGLLAELITRNSPFRNEYLIAEIIENEDPTPEMAGSQ